MKREWRERASAEPSLPDLKERFLDAVQRRDSNVFARQRLNYDARYCKWSGQSRDGKKWPNATNNNKPFPWPGASDARVALVDKYINEDVSFLMVVSDRMRTVVSGTESDDAGFAHRLTNLLRWAKSTQMPEYKRETRLAANYLLERGSAVLGVFWDYQEQLGWETIDLEALRVMAMKVQQAAAQGQPVSGDMAMIAQLPDMIVSGAREKEAVSLLGVAFPSVSKPTLRKAVRELRDVGTTRLPRAYVNRNRPCVVALAPNEEIFIPAETTELQMATGLFRRELLTESQLVGRERGYGWSGQWIDEMVTTQRGRMTVGFDSQVVRSSQRVSSAGILNTDKLFEVIHAYQRLHDVDGVPGIYYTCFNPHIGETYASHFLLDYDHGEYPFIHLERESRSRILDDARGYGEVGFTWQQQVKTQWDARVDRASLATLPPSYFPSGSPPDKWGPGVQIPTISPADYGFLDIPKYDAGSQEVEESVRRFADEYFGRPVDEQNVTQSQIMRQDLANYWMERLAAVDAQVLKLMQQFMPEEIYFRVVGSSKAQPLKASREEIQGSFDVSVGYNVADLDNEMVQAKLGLIEKALMMDTTGRVDRNQALDVVFELIDPDIGERILKPSEEASQQEIDDEQTILAKLLNGIDVDVKPAGQAYDLRLKVLQNGFANNPEAQKRFQESAQVRKVLEKRVKQLSHQLEQRENAIIGRLGA